MPQDLGFAPMAPPPVDPAEEYRRRLLEEHKAKFPQVEERPSAIPAPARAAAPPSPKPEASPPIVPSGAHQPPPDPEKAKTVEQSVARARTSSEAARMAAEQTRVGLAEAEQGRIEREKVDRQQAVTPGVTPPNPDVQADFKAAILAQTKAKYGDQNYQPTTAGVAKEGRTPQPWPGETGYAPPGAAIPTPEDEGFGGFGGWVSQELRGIGARGADLVGAFSGMQGDLLKFYGGALGDVESSKALQGVGSFLETAGGWLQEGDEAWRGLGEQIYTPIYDDVGKALEGAKNLEFGYMLGFMKEQAPIAFADAIASLPSAPAYIAALTADFANERAQNDGRAERTVEDYAYGTGAAMVSFVLDRFLLGKGKDLVGKFAPKLIDQLTNETKSGVLKRVLLGGGKGAAIEATEEAAQQALVTVDTKKGASVEDIALAAAGGAIAGAPIGAGVGMLSGGETAIPDETGVADDTKAAIQAAAGGGAERPMQGPQPLGPMQGPQLPAGPNLGPEPGPVQGPQLPAGPNLGPEPGPMQGPPAPPPGPAAQQDELARQMAADEAAAQAQAQAFDQEFPRVGIPEPAEEEAEDQEAYTPPGTQGMTPEGEAIAPVPEVTAIPEEDRERVRAESEARRTSEAHARARQRRLIREAHAAEAALKVPSAGRTLLGALETKRAIPEGTPEERRVKNDREWLAQFYSNLSDYARVLADRANRSNLPASESEPLKARMENAAVELSRARGEVLNVTQDYDQRGAAGEASPIDKANSWFRDTVAFDPLILGSLKIPHDAVLKAASGTDVGALRGLIDKIGTAAHGQVQAWEKKAGKEQSSAEFRSRGGRGDRPALPESEKRDFEETTPGRELQAEAQRLTSRGHISPAPTMTAESLGKDLRQLIPDPVTGKLIENPNFMGNRDETHPSGAVWAEEIAERKKEKASEEEQAQRIRGFLEPGRGEKPTGKIAGVRSAEEEEARLESDYDAAKARFEQARDAADETHEPVRLAEAAYRSLTGKAAPEAEYRTLKSGKQMRLPVKGAPQTRSFLEKRLAQLEKRDEPDPDELQHVRDQLKVADAWEALQLARRARATAMAKLIQADNEQERINERIGEFRAGKKGATRIGVAERTSKGAKTKKLTKSERDIRWKAKEEEKRLGRQTMVESERVQIEHAAERIARQAEQDAHPSSEEAVSEFEQARLAEREAIYEQLERARREADVESGRADRLERERIAKEQQAQAQATQAEYVAAGGNEEVAPSIPAQMKRRIKAIGKLRLFENDVKAGRIGKTPEEQQEAKDGLNTLLAMAQSIWDTRHTYKPDKGYWVVDTSDPDEPFKYIHNIIPKVDPTQPGRTRYALTPTIHNRKQMFFYFPTQVEPAPVGWRYGEAFRLGNQPQKITLTPRKDFPLNFAIFSPVKVDNHIHEIMKQGVTDDPGEARIISELLRNRRARAEHKSRSGARGHEGGQRAPRRKFEKAAPPRGGKAPDGTEIPTDLNPPVKVKIEDGKVIIEGGGPGGDGGTTTPVEPPVETPVEPPVETVEEPVEELTEEEREARKAALIEMLKKLKRGEPMPPELRRVYVSRVKELEEKIATLSDQANKAEALYPQITAELENQFPEDEKMRYSAPDGWPAEVAVKSWSTLEKGGDVYARSRPKEAYPGTADKTHRVAIMDSVKSTVGGVRKRIEILEKELERVRQAAAGSEGGGATGTGAGTPGTPATPVPPTPPRPRPVEPPAGGGPAVDARVSTRERAPDRHPVDLFGHIVRKPFSRDPVLDRFEFIEHPRPLAEGGTEIVRDRISESQKDTAYSIMHSYAERLALRLREGFRDAVNKAGYLVANGTGAGKSTVAAMAAEGMFLRQPKDGPTLPVLIVIPHGADSIQKAMVSLGLNPNDTRRYHFVTYPRLDQDAKGHYAGIILDEAHNIKSVEEGKTWAPTVAAIDAPFRVFLTATPTDMPMQESYYLSYMLQDDTKPLTFEEAQIEVEKRLGIRARTASARRLFTEAKAANRKLRAVEPNRYDTGLNELIEDAVVNNAASSYSLGSKAIASVNPIGSDQVLPEDMAAYNDAADGAQRVHMMEHLKVPAMVRRTLDQLRQNKPGEDWGVVTVFQRAARNENIKSVAHRQSAMDRFKKELEAAAKREGIKVNVGVLKGGMDPKKVAPLFRDGTYNVLVMNDTTGGTGIDLDDQSKGGVKPKLMLIANVTNMGQAWLQLMGRTDRQSTTSVAYIEYMALPNNKEDRDLRNDIKSKTDLQWTATGAKVTDARGVEGFTLKTQLSRDPKFRRKAKDVPDYASSVDRMIVDKLEAAPPIKVKVGDRRQSETWDEKYDASLTDQIPGRPALPAHELINAIARNETDPALAELAQALVGHPALNDVMVVLAADTVDEWGAYGKAFRNIILLASNTGAEAAVLLHEAVHHVTHGVIDTNPVARVRLQQIMRLVPASVATTTPAGGVLTDPHEFVAEAFANPRFQAALKKVRIGSTTAWQKFKDFVRALLGMRDQRLTVWDAVMELKLTEPGTVTDLGRGDVSTQLTTAMNRRRMAPDSVINAAEGARDFSSDLGFKALLASMTFDQIVKSFGKLSTDFVNGKAVNHLKGLYSLMEQRYTYATEQQRSYSKRVLEPLRKWAIEDNGGKKSIEVVMEPGGPKVKMTRMQYLSELMNLSGYGQVHFGKELTDDVNRMARPKNAKGIPVARTRSHDIWELHKPQFDRLGPEGQKQYNDIADFFADQIDQTGVLRAQQWLDAVEPLPDDESWFNAKPADVRAKIKEIRKLSDDELEKKSIVRDSLKQLHAILDPGRVPGAYFPLKRFGEFVVTAKESRAFTDDDERNDLLQMFPGATVDDHRKVIHYRAVSRFETQNDARAFRDQMRKDFPDAEVTDVMVSSDEDIVQKAGLSNALIEQYERRVRQQKGVSTAEKDAQIRMFVQSMIDLMPEASYADTFRPRKGVLGASLDITRGLHSYGSALAHYKAAALFSTQQRNANRDFDGFIYELEASTGKKASLDEAGPQAQKLRRIKAELSKRQALSVTAFTERKWAQSLNNVGFAYYLVSAGYNLINSLQPIMLTTPYLAGKFGGAAAGNAMRKAYAKAGGAPLRRIVSTGFTVKNLKGMVTGEDFDRNAYDVLTEMEQNLRKSGDVDHANLLRSLANRNLIEATIAMDMAQGAKRSHVDPRTGAVKPQGKLDYLTEWMRVMPHITEVMNRSVTAIAAYDLELARQLKKGATKEAATKAATEFAADVVNETQFNYQNWNKPRVLQGSAVARTMLMFKQHPQHVYYFMTTRMIQSSKPLWKKVRGMKLTPEEAQEASVAQTQLAYFVGFHLLAAGAIGGTPEPLKWLIGFLNMLFGDEDEPYNFELMVQNAMYDWLGPEWGTAAARGLPAMAGVDLSSRIGISSMLMFDRPSVENPDAFMADIFRIAGGPMVSLGERFFYSAPVEFSKGNYDKMFEALMPRAIRDAARAHRFFTKGFTTIDGRVYSEANQIGPLEMFLTSMGLNPTSTSEMYVSRTVDNQVQIMQDKRSELMRRAYFAVNDPLAFRDAIEEIARWSYDNPVFRVSRDDLIKSFRSRASNQEKTQGGMLVPEKYAEWAQFMNRFRNIPTPVVQ